MGLVLLQAGGLSAQPAFDVASVKRVVGDWVWEYKSTPTSLTWRGVTLGRLIRYAYNLQGPLQTVGPDWIDSGFNVLRFDIITKTEQPMSDEKRRLMMQALLAERWKLALHRETKTMPVYTLSRGKRELRLHKSETEGESSMAGSGQSIICVRATMGDLARRIADWVPRVVIDETGIEGRYDFNVPFLSYYTDDSPGVPLTQQDLAPAFARALQDLGLTLVSQRRSVEILVIDHVEKIPVEN